MGVQMSACYQCGELYPSAPAGHLHKCGRCSGYCSPIPTTPTTKAPAFQREERFIVLKRKHMNAGQEFAVRSLMERIDVKSVEAVVIESDWPEYETVWRMIEARMTGATTEAPDLVERVARAVCSAHGNDPDDFLKALGFCRWVMYQPHARAAIAAMPSKTPAEYERGYFDGETKWAEAVDAKDAEIARLREALEWLQDNQLCGLVKREEVVSAALNAPAPTRSR